MTLLGLDVNATRVRAVSGTMGDFPCPLPLDPPAIDLPMVISLDKPRPEVGLAGVRLVRQMPHLTFQDFLATLGEPSIPGRNWIARPQLDSLQALGLVFERLQPICSASDGVVLALPGYLSRSQAEMMLDLGTQFRFPILGSISAPVAGALAAYAEQAWYGSALVVDIDDHALTLTAVNAVEGQAHFLETRTLAHLGLRVWKERLLNALSDCCVMQSRRDPRASPMAEQALYEQLDGILDACRQGRLVQLALQAANWYQNLVVSPEQPVAYCANLVEHVVLEVEGQLSAPWPDGPPNVILLTAAAGRLPGLVHALRSFLEDWKPPLLHGLRTTSVDDFGEGLFQDGPGGSMTVLVLSADAPGRGAHTVAGYIHRGDLAPGHLDLAVPLPLPQPVDAGPARLHFQGEDYVINESNFSLGRQPGCNLVFDGNVYLSVSPRHCEILFDHRTFMLWDRSREGTLVNDCPVASSVVLRSGDWIRLGPDGPLLRFLGRGPDFSPLLTTA